MASGHGPLRRSFRRASIQTCDPGQSIKLAFPFYPSHYLSCLILSPPAQVTNDRSGSAPETHGPFADMNRWIQSSISPLVTSVPAFFVSGQQRPTTTADMTIYPETQIQQNMHTQIRGKRKSFWQRKREGRFVRSGRGANALANSTRGTTAILAKMALARTGCSLITKPSQSATLTSQQEMQSQ